MAQFNGVWKLIKVENFEAYLDVLGISSDIKAKALNLLNPSSDLHLEIIVDSGKITVKSKTPLWNTEHTSKFGESFKAPTLDGKEMQECISLEGDKLIETQKGTYTSNNTREIIDGKLVYTLVVKGVSTKRYYERV